MTTLKECFKTENQMWGEVEQSQFLWNLIYENLSKKIVML